MSDKDISSVTDSKTISLDNFIIILTVGGPGKILKLFISHYSVMYNLVDIGNDNIKYDNNDINIENSSSLLFNQKICFIFCVALESFIFKSIQQDRSSLYFYFSEYF